MKGTMYTDETRSILLLLFLISLGIVLYRHTNAYMYV